VWTTDEPIQCEFAVFIEVAGIARAGEFVVSAEFFRGCAGNTMAATSTAGGGRLCVNFTVMAGQRGMCGFGYHHMSVFQFVDDMRCGQPAPRNAARAQAQRVPITS